MILIVIGLLITCGIIIFSIKTWIDTKKITEARWKLEQFERIVIDPIREGVPERIIKPLNPLSIKKMRQFKNLITRYKKIPGVSWI